MFYQVLILCIFSLLSPTINAMQDNATEYQEKMMHEKTANERNVFITTEKYALEAQGLIMPDPGYISFSFEHGPFAGYHVTHTFNMLQKVFRPISILQPYENSEKKFDKIDKEELENKYNALMKLVHQALQKHHKNESGVRFKIFNNQTVRLMPLTFETL